MTEYTEGMLIQFNVACWDGETVWVPAVVVFIEGERELTLAYRYGGIAYIAAHVSYNHIKPR